jgi:hypothetical protein
MLAGEVGEDCAGFPQREFSIGEGRDFAKRVDGEVVALALGLGLEVNLDKLLTLLSLKA